MSGDETYWESIGRAIPNANEEPCSLGAIYVSLPTPRRTMAELRDIVDAWFECDFIEAFVLDGTPRLGGISDWFYYRRVQG